MRSKEHFASQKLIQDKIGCSGPTNRRSFLLKQKGSNIIPIVGQVSDQQSD